MVVTERYVFVHVPKTGGTLVRRLLQKHQKVVKVYRHWHKPYRDVCNKYQTAKPIAFIRNPWDYYVSHCTFAINRPRTTAGKKEIELTKPAFNKGIHRVFNRKGRFDPIDWSCFDEYVSADTVKKCPPNLQGTWHQVYLPRDQIMEQLDIGILTFRYLFMCFRNCVEIFKSGRLPDRAEHEARLSMRKVYRMEHMTEALTDLLGMTASLAAKQPKENKGKHRHYQEYYNSSTKDLIAHKERFIIGRYGYTF